jgi:hypothetical protein
VTQRVGRRARVRIWAGLAAVATGIGAVLVVAAVLGTRRLWFGGYISEAGVASSGHASLYRAGILGLALGQLLLGLALLVRVRPVWVGGLLVAAGLFGGGSAAVPCSAGCPLPPHETPTAMDLVHAGVSIAAVAAVSLAILALALLTDPAAMARWAALGDRWTSWLPVTPSGLAGLVGPSRLAALIVVPMVAADGLAILVLGRGHVTGLLERGVLVGATAWTLVMCRRLASYPS